MTKIIELFAWVATESSGKQSIPVSTLEDGITRAPLVRSTLDAALAMKSVAEQVLADDVPKVELVRFVAEKPTICLNYEETQD